MNDPTPAQICEQNRRSWNAATRAHNSRKRDQAAFLRGGGSTLFEEELRLLGDIRGRRIAHLQCNSGQDSLSLAQLGAAVVGVDISDEAISAAQRLAQESGIAAEFVRADIYDWLAAAPDQSFDLVFASYGALCWLIDLREYFRGVARMLRLGGRYVIVEFHPVAQMFDESGEMKFDYSTAGRPVQSSGVSDYVAFSGEGLAPSGFIAADSEFRNPHPCYQVQWSNEDVLSAVLAAGLRLDRFEEFDYSNGCRWTDKMHRDEHNRWRPPDGAPRMPYMFGLVASRPAENAP